jgi:hypothetical protein
MMDCFVPLLEQQLQDDGCIAPSLDNADDECDRTAIPMHMSCGIHSPTKGAPSTEDLKNTKGLQKKDGKSGSTRKNSSNLYPVKKATSLTPLSRSKQMAKKRTS